MAIFTKIRKQSGLTMEMLQLDQDDAFEPECYELLLEPIENDFDALPPSPARSAVEPGVAVTGTRKVTIRIPNRTLASCMAKAARTGTKYQTLIVRTLNTASRDWAT